MVSIIADFSNNSKANFYEDLQKQIFNLGQKMKIQICIINAGVMNPGSFIDCSERELADMIDINCY